MFKGFVRAVGLTCLAGVAGLGTEAKGAATISLKAIKKNGSPIAATNSVQVARNDIITAEIYIAGWTTPPFDDPTNSGVVQTYQASLLGAASAISNGGDPTINAQLVVPEGWIAPITRETCSFGCPNPLYPLCDPFFGCIGAGHSPAKMINVCVGGTLAGLICSVNTDCTGGGTCPQINNTRSDYIFFGYDTVRSVANDTLDIRWGGTINNRGDGQTTIRCQGGSSNGEQCPLAGCGIGGTCNQNFVSYAGTLNLKVGAQACGTYLYTFSDDIDLTFLENAEDLPVVKVPTIEGLTLTVTGFPCESGACCDTTNPNSPTCSVVAAGLCTGPNKRYGGPNSTCANINPPCAVPTGACCVENTGTCTNGVTQANCTGRWGGPGITCANISPPCVNPSNTIIGVNPANCLIDARIPNVQGTLSNFRGYTSMTLTFANTPGPGEDAPADFQVTQVPPPLPNPPTINNPVVVVGNTVRLDFNRSIQGNHWTCIRHLASNKNQCIGFLSGDASSNRTAAPADIIDIIDSLNGVRAAGPLLIHQCDIDRSGICNANDIIAEIDMLNGNGYPNQNGKTLEVCPSAP